MKPAVFLDRDGVLTVEKSYVAELSQMEVFSYAKECVMRLKSFGFYVIVVTNQSGVARGLILEEELQKMNEYLIREMGVDAVYYCPHHPGGMVLQYTCECTCRKPETGMIQKACEDYDIDMAHSYMIGDRASDILMGQNAGIDTVLLESGYGTKRLEEDVMPDFVMRDLREFCEYICR